MLCRSEGGLFVRSGRRRWSADRSFRFVSVCTSHTTILPELQGCPHLSKTYVVFIRSKKLLLVEATAFPSI